MIWNETINAARLGLRAAIKTVQEFDSSFTDAQALTLLVTVADIEGSLPLSAMQHDTKLYEEVRRRLQ